MVSQCFSITRTWWKVAAVLLVLTTFFQGLVLLPIRDCEYDGINYKDCQLAQNAVGCIVACCLWFTCAVGSMYIAKFRGQTHESVE